LLSDPGHINAVLKKRSRQIVVVLEDLYQPHNASSILRTCDAFGVQDLYIISHRNRFQFAPEKSMGMENWVNRIEFTGESATQTCLTRLKRAGYTIAATSLRPGCVLLDDLAVPGKLALCFGTEEKGLSETAHQLADIFIRIPMFGLTQSFNVSVTVALSLQKLHDSLKPNGPEPLNPEELDTLKKKWLSDRQSSSPNPSPHQTR